MKKQEFLKMIDHTLLSPEAGRADIKKLCDEAKEYGFGAVCVNPCHITYAAQELKGSGIAPCSVVGFPLGASLSESKEYETQRLIDLGAKEIDMVMNIGAAKHGDFSAVQNDIEAVVETAKGRALVKVIIEACLLTDEEKIKVCKAAQRAGADFVKTSTGFSKSGATTQDVALMRRTVGDKLGVKASGGIRDLKTALEMVAAGANRLGTSAGVEIAAALTAIKGEIDANAAKPPANEAKEDE
jgi:deoxyribose-phosphate aldolase